MTSACALPPSDTLILIIQLVRFHMQCILSSNDNTSPPPVHYGKRSLYQQELTDPILHPESDWKPVTRKTYIDDHPEEEVPLNQYMTRRVRQFDDTDFASHVKDLMFPDVSNPKAVAEQEDSWSQRQLRRVAVPVNAHVATGFQKGLSLSDRAEASQRIRPLSAHLRETPYISAPTIEERHAMLHDELYAAGVSNASRLREPVIISDQSARGFRSQIANRAIVRPASICDLASGGVDAGPPVVTRRRGMSPAALPIVPILPSRASSPAARDAARAAVPHAADRDIYTREASRRRLYSQQRASQAPQPVQPDVPIHYVQPIESRPAAGRFDLCGRSGRSPARTTDELPPDAAAIQAETAAVPVPVVRYGRGRSISQGANPTAPRPAWINPAQVDHVGSLIQGTAAAGHDYDTTRRPGRRMHSEAHHRRGVESSPVKHTKGVVAPWTLASLDGGAAVVSDRGRGRARGASAASAIGHAAAAVSGRSPADDDTGRAAQRCPHQNPPCEAALADPRPVRPAELDAAARYFPTDVRLSAPFGTYSKTTLQRDDVIDNVRRTYPRGERGMAAALAAVPAPSAAPAARAGWRTRGVGTMRVGQAPTVTTIYTEEPDIRRGRSASVEGGLNRRFAHTPADTNIFTRSPAVPPLGRGRSEQPVLREVPIVERMRPRSASVSVAPAGVSSQDMPRGDFSRGIRITQPHRGGAAQALQWLQ